MCSVQGSLSPPITIGSLKNARVGAASPLPDHAPEREQHVPRHWAVNAKQQLSSKGWRRKCLSGGWVGGTGRKHFQPLCMHLCDKLSLKDTNQKLLNSRPIQIKYEYCRDFWSKYYAFVFICMTSQIGFCGIGRVLLLWWEAISQW